MLWALARQQGKPTAGDKTISADVILAAQSLTLGASPVVVATTNIGHLSRFVPAELWQNISPCEFCPVHAPPVLVREWCGGGTP